MKVPISAEEPPNNTFSDRDLEMIKIGVEIGRRIAKVDAEHQKRSEGIPRRVLDDVAARCRWALIQIACDGIVERQGKDRPTQRILPDLPALFADNAEVMADAWQLRHNDPRRKGLIARISRKVTRSTILTAERYLNARLSGQTAEEAQRDVEAWSLFRP